MRNVDFCLVCGSTQQQELYKSTYHGNADDSTEFFLAQRRETAHGQIVRCCECGFVYTGQQFESIEYQSIYEAASKRQSHPDCFLAAESARGRRLAKLIARHVPSKGKLLDFGCGQGGFLQAVHGLEKTGFEIAPMPSHDSVDAQIITGDFLSFEGHDPFSRSKFDVITAFDVFEHLPDLDQYLYKLTTIAHSNCILVVTVPNIESYSSKLWGNHWGLLLLEHLWYFSPQTLKKFMEQFGWQTIESGHVPYDVTLNHLTRRTSQLIGLRQTNGFSWLSSIILPIPVGLMYAVFRKF